MDRYREKHLSSETGRPEQVGNDVFMAETGARFRSENSPAEASASGTRGAGSAAASPGTRGAGSAAASPGARSDGSQPAEPIDLKNKGKSKGSQAGDFLRSLLIDVIIAVILAAIVLYFVRPTIVKQTSMENTLHNNDYMIMYKQAYRSAAPERGDIIIFQSSLPDENTGRDKLLIKRVIGLPGDEIAIIDDQLYINGEAYYEDYLKDGYTPAFEIPLPGESYTVPDGEYFVMGDNRAGSIDSRRAEVGTVAFGQIKGKVVLRLFPFNKIQRF